MRGSDMSNLLESEFSAAVISVAAISLGVGAVAYWAGVKHENERFKTVAVKAGVAKWIPSEDGSTRFEWSKHPEQQ